MRLRASLVVGAVLVLATSHLAAGQGFQGGLRGSLKDTGGVVPGVEVTLINEQTNITRSTVTNERGEYSFANVDPGTYARQGGAAGIQDDRARRHPHRHAAVPHARPDARGRRDRQRRITVTGEAPLIETSNASQGTVLDSRGAADAAGAGPRGVPVRRHDPDGHPLGRRAVQPAAGSDQRVAAVARRRHAPRQQLRRSTACRSPT